MRSILLILELNRDNLLVLGKEKESKIFHKLHVLRMNDDLWNNVGESVYAAVGKCIYFHQFKVGGIFAFRSQ